MKKLLAIVSLVAGLHLDAEEPAKEMATAATVLLSSLDESQLKKIQFPFISEERENWNYIPKTRQGLALESMSEKQISLVRSLLKSALSDSGIKKAETIVALEKFLWESSNKSDFRNPKAYFTTIFGQPSATGTWAWRYEGHHFSVNYTIIEGKAIAVTPNFFGASPAEVTTEHPLQGTRVLASEEDSARELAKTLRDAGKAVIFSEKPPREILTQADRNAKQLEPVGISVSEMIAAEKAALFAIISEFTNRHREELAAVELEKINTSLPKLHFGWAGSLEKGQPFYYRIQGGTLLIEVANVQNGGNHIHTVWRNISGDFGRDLLGDHIHHDH